MAPTKKFLAMTGFAAVVAAGGAAGALIGVPATSVAQSGDTTTTSPSHDSDGSHDSENTDDTVTHWRGEFGHRIGGLGGLCDLDVAADALGIDESDLRDALADGKSIADVAQEQGVDLQAVVDALVAEANAEVDGAVADGDIDENDAADRKAGLEERITDMVEGSMPAGPGFGHHGGPGSDHRGGPGSGHGPGLGDGLDTAADALGIDSDELISALRDGKTIADVAQEQGVDVDTVIEALVDEARDRISDFVNNGFDALDDDSGGDSGNEDADNTAT